METADALREAGRFSDAQRLALERHLALVKERGYAFTRSTRSRRVNGMAVPIVRGSHVLGALTLRYPKRAMSEEQAAARFAGPLAATARQIAARAFEAHPTEPVRLGTRGSPQAIRRG